MPDITSTTSSEKSKACTLEVFFREGFGTKFAKKARRQDQIPAVVYGDKKPVEAVFAKRHQVNKAIENPSFHSHFIDLMVSGKIQKVILKDLQMDPCGIHVQHMDFMRISEKTRLTMDVALHFVGVEDMPGATEDGQLETSMVTVSVQCLPADLPDAIEVDVSGMHLGDVIHLSKLSLPKGVTLTQDISGDHDHAVCAVHKVKEQAVEEELAPEDDAEEAAKEAGDGKASSDDAGQS
jgi:large subunit ribosomal protein L25